MNITTFHQSLLLVVPSSRQQDVNNADSSNGVVPQIMAKTETTDQKQRMNDTSNATTDSSFISTITTAPEKKSLLSPKRSNISSVDNNNNNNHYRIGLIRRLLYILVSIGLALIIVELRGFNGQQQQQSYSKSSSCSCGDFLPSQRPMILAAANKSTIINNNNNNNNHNHNKKEEEIIMLAPKLTNASLAIMVLSRRDAFATRKAIRETWGNGRDNIYFVLGQGCTVPIKMRAKDEGGNPICKVFSKPLPGHYKNATQKQYDQEHDLDTLIREEQVQYGDILLGTDFVDIYRTLPKKLKTAYTFVHEYLPSVEWVLKVDDDFFVRIDALEQYLYETFPNPRTTPYVVGRIVRTNKAHPHGKWKEVPQYPKQGLYPPFPVGSSGHIVSRPIVDYVSDNQHLLFEYQGEDASLGIWLQDDFGPNIFKGVGKVTSAKDCLNDMIYVVGHNLNGDEMRVCQEWIKHDGLTPKQQLMELAKLNQTKFEGIIKKAKKRYGGGND